jgi:glycine dehydrogenase subunit 1
VRFIPHTPSDIEAMLATLGLASVDDLFTDVPVALRRSARLDLPDGLAEQGVRRRLAEFADANRGAGAACFLGAGSYPHFSPAVVDHVIQRAEFYSAYTPYQPEVSQGTLQAIFEFQTMISGLLGLEIANASMYDGASSAAEAVLMALRSRPKRRRVILSRALHPQYAEVIRTYVRDGGDVELLEVPWATDGGVDLGRLQALLDDGTAAVVVGYPNVFGVVEDLARIGAAAAAVEALTISVTTEALALAVLKAPGDLGADIAVAEGQSLGIPMSYGGPGIGLFATRPAHLRSMPGRLVGQTVDEDGRRAFVLTLATREQHIRREKATSNICTNHSLMALAVTVYLATLGRRGLRAVAAENVGAAHGLAERLCRGGVWRRRFAAPFFNEFVLERPGLAAVLERSRDAAVLPGLALEGWYPELRDCLLLCATEVHSNDDIDRLVEVLS